MNIRVTLGNPVARRSIEDAIERLLAMLDQMDADPDYEPSNDDEPTLGWPDDKPGCGAERRIISSAGPDERELEDEHGGDILDERHDGDEDDEDELGWPETCDQAPCVGGSAQSYAVSTSDGEKDE